MNALDRPWIVMQNSIIYKIYLSKILKYVYLKYLIKLCNYTTLAVRWKAMCWYKYRKLERETPKNLQWEDGEFEWYHIFQMKSKKTKKCFPLCIKIN